MNALYHDLVQCYLVRWPLLLLLALPVRIALAHPVPDTQATLDVDPAGEFTCHLRCDAAALVMQAPPGHLGELANQLREMPAEDLEARIEDARRALAYYLHITFDGEESGDLSIEFPAAEVIRAAAAHGEETNWPKIEIQGHINRTARTLTVAFPESLGNVQFRFQRDGKTLQTLTLSPGQVSPPLLLEAPQHQTHPPGWNRYDTLGLILAAAIAVFLCWRPLRRQFAHK